MSQQELLKRVVQTLQRTGIEYMITGSVASSFQGEPRSTHDIDLVVAISELQAPELVKAFPQPHFYLDERSVLEAIGGLSGQSMFNLIDLKSGDKVDFWILADEDFDRSRFSRKISQDFMGLAVQVSSPEDTILAKLKWAKLSGGSEKQFTDALRVYEVQYDHLDLDYLQHWAKKLDIYSLWKRVTDEAETA